jgi:epoxyqueuosine reductase
MKRSAQRRADVRQILPSARSVIVLATVYNTDVPYSTEVADPATAAIARYAWGDDYHEVIQRRLDDLLAWLREASGPEFEGRAYVDTGPVQERVYAQHGGIGWIGKNTCVIHPQIGSWIFLSEIICNLALDPDAPIADHCGTCTLCIEACPTGALVGERVLDSNRCISYLTIENKGSIAVEFRDAIGEHAYGCDICQEVCPYNHAPARTSETAYHARDGLRLPHLTELWSKRDDDLRALLKGSAMKRAGVRRLRRNLAVSLGNSGDASAADALVTNTEETAQDPLVREHVAWAVEKLRG